MVDFVFCFSFNGNKFRYSNKGCIYLHFKIYLENSIKYFKILVLLRTLFQISISSSLPNS